MSSELGLLIREARTSQNMGLRELARRVELSPSMIVRLESDDSPPQILESNLRAIAEALNLDPDEVIMLGGKVPADVLPKNLGEVALFRKVKQLSPEELKKILE